MLDPGTGDPLPEHNWVWSPQGLIAMHCPEMWGEVMFTANGEHDFEDSEEHRAILAAASLMPVYYKQKQWHEDHGQFASSLGELGISTDPRWTLTMETCAEGFTARLVTPHGTATVDQDGRLERKP